MTNTIKHKTVIKSPYEWMEKGEDELEGKSFQLALGLKTTLDS